LDNCELGQNGDLLEASVEEVMMADWEAWKLGDWEAEKLGDHKLEAGVVDI
jgi:hypothetical protein